MSLNDKARAALKRELQKAFPERAPDDAGHGRLADALTRPAPRRFYLVPLNPQSKGMTDRYAAYEETPEGLQVVWAKHDQTKPSGSKGAHVPAFGQVHSTRREYPAFHYALNGCGYSKPQQIGEYLQAHVGKGIEIEVFVLGGCHPSSAYRTRDYSPRTEGGAL
jgi:hypothetical protein